MTLKDALELVETKTLFRMLNSAKEYFMFEFSVFNVGTYVNVVCTNNISTPKRNGYDFLTTNSTQNKNSIIGVLKERELTETQKRFLNEGF